MIDLAYLHLLVWYMYERPSSYQRQASLIWLSLDIRLRITQPDLWSISAQTIQGFSSKFKCREHRAQQQAATGHSAVGFSWGWIVGCRSEFGGSSEASCRVSVSVSGIHSKCCMRHSNLFWAHRSSFKSFLVSTE